MTPPRKPTIDERLEALTQSLELLTRDHEAKTRRLDEEMRRLDRRERNAREALLSGIAAYLQALKADDNGQPTE
jgi:hypothetical protein